MSYVESNMTTWNSFKICCWCMIIQIMDRRNIWCWSPRPNPSFQNAGTSTYFRNYYYHTVNYTDRWSQDRHNSSVQLSVSADDIRVQGLKS